MKNINRRMALPSKTILVPTSLALILCILPPTIATPDFKQCGSTGLYNSSSSYASNLNSLLGYLSSKGYSSGFAKRSFGEVEGLVLCRGDATTTQCHACLDTAVKDAPLVCSKYKEAFLVYELCRLRYSDDPFIDSFGNLPEFYKFTPDKVKDGNTLNLQLGVLLDRISQKAAYNSSHHFATGEIDLSAEYPKIYGLVQCTPDMIGDQCLFCLEGLSDRYLSRFSGRKGGRIVGIRCNLRYEVDLWLLWPLYCLLHQLMKVLVSAPNK